MNAHLRIYVSMDAHNHGRIILRKRAPRSPADLSSAHAGLYAIGPFRTYLAADLCARGEYSPAIQCVAQFEREARRRQRIDLARAQAALDASNAQPAPVAVMRPSPVHKLRVRNAD